MEDMKLFQIILVLSSLLFLNNCVGVHPEKVDMSKVKKERKLPDPDFLIPDAQYITSGNGSSWNARHFMDFRFWSPPFFNSKEEKARGFKSNRSENSSILKPYSKRQIPSSFS